MMQRLTVFDFNATSNISRWTVIDDTVMGGRSAGKFEVDEMGRGLYSGLVSLENNGGFSSLKYRLDDMSVEVYSHFNLLLQGDGNHYQFVAKSSVGDAYSYRYDFITNGDQQLVSIPFSEMYPSFRGRKLDQPNFQGGRLSEIGFLVANKKQESFALAIYSIELG